MSPANPRSVRSAQTGGPTPLVHEWYAVLVARDWRSRTAAVAWWPIALLALLMLGGAGSAVIGHDDGWAIEAVEGTVLGLLALGIALDLRRRSQHPTGTTRPE